MCHLFCVLIISCLILRLLVLSTHQPPHVATPPRRWRLGPAPRRSVAFNLSWAGGKATNFACLFSSWRQQASQRRAGRTPTTRGGPTRFRRAEAPLPSPPTAERPSRLPEAGCRGHGQRWREGRSRSTGAAVQKNPSVTVTGAAERLGGPYAVRVGSDQVMSWSPQRIYYWKNVLELCFDRLELRVGLLKPGIWIDAPRQNTVHFLTYFIRRKKINFATNNYLNYMQV